MKKMSLFLSLLCFSSLLMATTSIVPEQFLRRWDPVTLFFTHDSGPSKPQVAKDVSHWVTMQPTHPGQYSWLNARTLQFRPAEPWPALAKFEWQTAHKKFTLMPLMSAPQAIRPSQKRPLLPFEQLIFGLSENVPLTQVRQILSVSLSPMPGIENIKRLKNTDYDLKRLEKTNYLHQTKYLLTLHQVVPPSSQLVLNFKLAHHLAPESKYQLIYKTAPAFHVQQLFCNGQTLSLFEQGQDYTAQQALQCNTAEQKIKLRFSKTLKKYGYDQWRQAFQFNPALPKVGFSQRDNVLEITAQFKSETVYKMTINPQSKIENEYHQSWIQGQSHAFFYFPKQHDYIQFDTGHVMLERFGPQMLPLQGRGFSHIDLRIHRIDPLDRSFWPFPKQITVSDDIRPPTPGNIPAPYQHSWSISSQLIAKHIKALGSADFSQVIKLPLKKNRSSAKFGLDIRPFLNKINANKSVSGTYLIGLRPLNDSANRDWIRVQVTDLSLITIAEPAHVLFSVNSLHTGKAVKQAKIHIEVRQNGVWKTQSIHYTDAKGLYLMKAEDENTQSIIRRISVQNNEDILVIDPDNAPDNYYRGHWEKSYHTWLQWTQKYLKYRGEQAHNRCHIFTERPVYKAEHTVHIKGFIRHYEAGQLKQVSGSKGTLVVNGPDHIEWRYPMHFTPQGGFYHPFVEKDLPVGDYTSYLIDKNQQRCGFVNFRKEAYKLPKFAVNLTAADKVAMDEAFKLTLVADYYAGGVLVQRPVRWRITQFPYDWKPAKKNGFYYSSDGRYSTSTTFRATAKGHHKGYTDSYGGAELRIDPRLEETANARRYIVEATVTGDDDETVSNTHQILALPAFVLGLKVPRYIAKKGSIPVQFYAQNEKGQFKSGLPLQVKVIQRQWHSYLQAADIRTGKAHYKTEKVDTVIFDQQVISSDEISALDLPADRAGVYVVEILALDKMRRSQQVQVDLFVGGEQPVSWQQPATLNFTISLDKTHYKPGELAQVTVQSPFQKARLLKIQEMANGRNYYQWYDINNGALTLPVLISKDEMPKMPLHFVLIRGRLAGKMLQNHIDLAKPKSLMNTVWIAIDSVQQQLAITLDYPKIAVPGETIKLEIGLVDFKKQPVAGEVTLWLVDQAVLALGKEQKLDPLTDFIVKRKTHVKIHDTRNTLLGYLPLQEYPGGDGGVNLQAGDLLNKVTLRKNFQAVPFYKPTIPLTETGKMSVNIKLPDNLTRFKIRAKASSDDRFGFARGQVAIRLPLIVQTAAPKFIRVGDIFTVSALTRVLDKGYGSGETQLQSTGGQLKNAAKQTVLWQDDRVSKIDYTITNQISTPGKAISLVLQVHRHKDHAQDAIQLSIPVLGDRKTTIRNRNYLVLAGQQTQIESDHKVRKGSYQGILRLSNQAELLTMAAAFDYLMQFPYGCSEQRISKARGILLNESWQSLFSVKTDKSHKHAIKQTVNYLESMIDDNTGLISYWPGSQGTVTLTAWTLQLLYTAENAGYKVNKTFRRQLENTLKKSLRSDFSYYGNSEHFSERVWALIALSQGNSEDHAYVMELARKFSFLGIESQAQILYLLHKKLPYRHPLIQRLGDELWTQVKLKQANGKINYLSLQQTPDNPLILASENRSIASLLQALAKDKAHSDRAKILYRALVNLGQDRGWGDTNSNIHALLALTSYIQQPEQPLNIELKMTNTSQSLQVDRLLNIKQSEQKAMQISNHSKQNLYVQIEAQFLAAKMGYYQQPETHGFVVKQFLTKVKQEKQEKHPLSSWQKAYLQYHLTTQDIVEYHIQVINPEDRHHVVIGVPLAGGMRYMNPALLTSSLDAKGPKNSKQASYMKVSDAEINYFFDYLAKGTYNFYFRAKASIVGQYTQPASYAEMMYQHQITGNSSASQLIIE